MEKNYENTVCPECTSDDQGYDLKDGCEASDKAETADRAHQRSIWMWTGLDSQGKTSRLR